MEKNLKHTVKSSGFALEEKILFYKKKWLEEHVAFMCLLGIVIVALFAVGVILSQKQLMAAAILSLVLSHVWRSYAMRNYVKQNTSDGAESGG